LAKKTKKILLKRIKTPKGFFTNKYRFKLRWTPFEEYPQVNKQTYQDVYDLLGDSLMPFGISLDRKSADPAIVGEPQGPMHASDAVTVDAVIKVIMSQATDNEKALLAQAKLIKTFPYTVNGKTVVGKIPNYHDVRTADFAKLADALSPAGLQKKRAEIIPECLNAIRQKNIDANSPGCSIDSNPPNAADFIPGSLSLDYLTKLNSQEKLDALVSLPGIGIKTAACILSFSFQLPVFAVDTHVFRMVKWLGWIPEGCNRNDASAHLDMLIPDHLKYGLHQGFWHHGQKCLRCKARNDQKTDGREEAVCVLEEFLKRQPRKERKSPAQKRKREAEDSGDADSPKPKAQKAKMTMITRDWTEEKAAEQGYEAYLKYDVDDNFKTKGANITHTRKVWVKKTA
jgi:endonuclease III